MASKTVAVLGLGSIGRRHAGNLQALGYTVIGYDPMGSIVVGSVEAAIQMADRVVIASPSDTHLGYFRQSIRAGKPTFVEKPFVMQNGEEITTLLQDAERRNIPVMTGYNLRFHHCVQEAEQKLLNESIGTPIWAHFTVAQKTEKPPYLKDGVILNWSHEIDLALHLLGPAEVLCAAARIVDGKEDIADFVLSHQGGCRSNIHMDYVTEPRERWFHIRGTKGSISANLEDRTFSSPLGVRAMKDSWDLNYRAEISAFMNQQGFYDVLGATGHDGMETVKIALKVREMAGLK